MTVRQRARANLHAHLVEDHGYTLRATTPPRRTRRRPAWCTACWRDARADGETLRDAWRYARTCQNTRGRTA